MKLISFNVVISKVNDVINIFLKLVGKSLENCFFCKIVDVIVSEKIVVSSVQVGKKLEGKNIILYLDEINKFGKIYNIFLILDEDKNVYCLGLRDMCNKLFYIILEIFKEIRNKVCNENIDKIYCDKILCNFQNFMFDRVKINIVFIDLLVDYRKEIMLQILKLWDDLDFEQ